GSGNETGPRHLVQDHVDADGEVPRLLHAGPVEGGGLVRAGQAAGDDRAALARHPGGGPVHAGDQPALLPAALTRPDHRHRPRLTRPGGFLPGRPSLQTSWPGRRVVRKSCSPRAWRGVHSSLSRARARSPCSQPTNRWSWASPAITLQLIPASASVRLNRAVRPMSVSAEPTRRVIRAAP